MAVLASKVSYSAGMGIGSGQTPSVAPFSASLSNHRAPVLANLHQAPFASPTESEFSEGIDGMDSVR